MISCVSNKNYSLLKKLYKIDKKSTNIESIKVYLFFLIPIGYI